MSNDFVPGMFLGFLCGAAAMAVIFLVGDAAWADARNRMMAQCTERYTYQSCIDNWSGVSNKVQELEARP